MATQSAVFHTSNFHWSPAIGLDILTVKAEIHVFFSWLILIDLLTKVSALDKYVFDQNDILDTCKVTKHLVETDLFLLLRTTALLTQKAQQTLKYICNTENDTEIKFKKIEFWLDLLQEKSSSMT